MMNSIRSYLTEVDGTLCLCLEKPEQEQPRIIKEHYPTRLTLRAFCRWFQLTEETFSTCPVNDLQCGLFVVKHPERWGLPVEQTISLRDGGVTQPIKVEHYDAPRPTTRSEIEYDNGFWWKNLQRGWTRIEWQDILRKQKK